MNKDELYQKCLAYMEEQKTVLWGQYFDLHDGPRDAAYWLAGVIEEVLDERRHDGVDLR